MLVTTPHGDSDVKVTVVLTLLFVLFVTYEITPTVVPGAVVVGDTRIDSPRSEVWALTGAGTNTMLKQKRAKRLFAT